jgi:hypothetical protein
VVDEVVITRIVQHGRELRGQDDGLVELTQWQQPGVGGERGVGDLDLNGQQLVEIEVEQRNGVRTHDRPPMPLPMACYASVSTITVSDSCTSDQCSRFGSGGEGIASGRFRVAGHAPAVTLTHKSETPDLLDVAANGPFPDPAGERVSLCQTSTIALGHV